MRVLLPLALLSVLVLSTGTSFAQTVGPVQQILGIYAQIKVQDSSGNLVSYLETSRVLIVDPVKLSQLIDQNAFNMSKSNTINVGGQNIEIIRINGTVIHTYASITSQDFIALPTSQGTKILVNAIHDGYPVLKGDKVTTYWTIIRTVS